MHKSPVVVGIDVVGAVGNRRSWMMRVLDRQTGGYDAPFVVLVYHDHDEWKVDRHRWEKCPLDGKYLGTRTGEGYAGLVQGRWSGGGALGRRTRHGVGLTISRSLALHH